jgi:hypothetical protein
MKPREPGTNAARAVVDRVSTAVTRTGYELFGPTTRPWFATRDRPGSRTVVA